MKKKNRARNRHIYEKLNRIYLFSMLLPTILLAVFLSIYFYNRLRDDYMDMNRSILDTVSVNISTCFEHMNRCSLAWVANDEIYEFYKSVNSNNGDIPTMPIQLDQNYMTACNTILSLSGKEISGIVYYPLTSAESKFYYYKKYSGNIQAFTGYNVKEQPWYQPALQSLKPVFYEPHDAGYITRGNTRVFSLLRKVRNLDSMRDIGIVKVDVSADYLREAFRNVHSYKNSCYMILNNENQIVYSTDETLNDLSSYYSEGVASVRVPGRGQYGIYSVPIKNSDWRLVYFGASRDIFARTNAIFYITVFLSIVTIVIAFIMFRHTSRRLTQPVTNILNTIERNETENFTVKIQMDEDSDDEFSLIAKQYNHMIDKLKLHIDREYKAKLEQQKAEFYALQMQINPHFLYNILNGIVALNRIGENKLLEKTVIELTRLFHYTCSNQHISTINAEMEFVQRYLFLQQLRFSERLEYTVYYEEELQDVAIPKLLLQPLVENAIIHGLEPVDRIVHVSVKAETVEEDKVNNQKLIRITVQDDGCGTDEENFDESKHVGLDNLRKRIHLFLPDGSFSFHSVPGEGTIIAIEFRGGMGPDNA